MFSSYKKQFEFDMEGSCNSDSSGHIQIKFLHASPKYILFFFSVGESDCDIYLYLRLDL